MIPYTASLYNGLSRLFGMAFDIDYSICVIVMAVLTAIYVIAGGCCFLGGFGRLFADQVDVVAEGYDAIIPAMLSGLSPFLIAVVVMLANIFDKSSFPVLLQSPINAGAFCMLCGLIIVPLVSFLTPKHAAEHLSSIFSCYERTVTVAVTDLIGDQTEEK